MTEEFFWNNGLDSFYRHLIYYENKQTSIIQKLDYLAWRTGESCKSALETTAILSLMVDGKDARKALKKLKYQEAPAYILRERQKEKKHPTSKKLTDEQVNSEKQRLFNYVNNKIKPRI